MLMSRRVECGLEWWERSGGKKGVVGGQVLRLFRTPHLEFAVEVYESRFTAARASGQEISTNICSILLSFI